MKTPSSLLGAGTLGLVLLLACATGRAQSADYTLVEDWASLPSGIEWGQVVAIDVDREGNIFALQRCGADTCIERDEPPLLKLDTDGRVTQVWGSGMLVWPHGLHIDHEGFIWISDGRGIEGRGHQVFKISPTGDVLLTLGVAGVAGEAPGLLNGPTDVAVAANGDVFVADGHGNNRVVKFSRTGDFVMAWGRRGAAPGEFDVPHAIAIDSRGRVFVGDRDNNRIQIFDQNGEFIDEWTQFGSPSGFYLAQEDVLWVAHSLGVYAGNTRDGRVSVSIPYTEVGAEAGNIEDVAADASGNIYAGLAGPLGLHKLARR